MPTLFFIGLFAFLMTMMSAVVMEISKSRQELTQQLAVETREYFKRIEDFVNLDMVPNALEIQPRALTGMNSEDAGKAFLSQNAIKLLAPPALNSDPLKDAWGVPLTVRMVTQNSALDTYTVAPVNGLFILSAGADNISQTRLNGVPDTLNGYQNVIAQGDDILTVLTTGDPLRKRLLDMYKDLNFIKTVLERDFNEHYRLYREQKINEYTADSSGAAPDFNQLAISDPNFPAMLSLSDSTQRRRLGVDEAFTRLERILPNGGRMRVATTASTTLSVTFGLINDPINPSPWPTLGPRVTAHANLE